jgi:hypothetical protein
LLLACSAAYSAYYSEADFFFTFYSSDFNLSSSSFSFSASAFFASYKGLPLACLIFFLFAGAGAAITFYLNLLGVVGLYSTPSPLSPSSACLNLNLY